jgi:hypothetical protein
MMADGPVKVVETSDVSDVVLTKIINEMVGQGWRLDTIHFAMREASRRPAMAFLVFFRPDAAAQLGIVES